MILGFVRLRVFSGTYVFLSYLCNRNRETKAVRRPEDQGCKDDNIINP